MNFVEGRAIAYLLSVFDSDPTALKLTHGLSVGLEPAQFLEARQHAAA